MAQYSLVVLKVLLNIKQTEPCCIVKVHNKLVSPQRLNFLFSTIGLFVIYHDECTLSVKRSLLCVELCLLSLLRCVSFTCVLSELLKLTSAVTGC